MYIYLRKFKIFYFLLFLLFSIKTSAYLIPEEEVREIETIDHEICLSKGVELTDNYSRRMYWQCRLNLIIKRIRKVEKSNSKNKFYVTELKRIKKVITNYIEKIQNDIDYGNENNKLYNKTILRKEDAYYYNLLHFGKIDFDTENVNKYYEIAEVIETKNALEKKKKKQKLKADLKKFPECIIYDVESEDFNKCLEFKNSVEKCKELAEKKIKERDIEDKFYCKQLAIEKYPDHFVLYNSEYQELKNIKRHEYVINRTKEAEIERRLLELNSLMSGPRLSPNQLIGLRKYEEEKCLIDKKLENSMSRVLLIGECENMILKNNKNNESN